MGGKFLYFAYGSNMLFERIEGRCPFAELIGTASVKGYKLAFHKKSNDGSAKADIIKCDDENSIVCGVVYKIGDEHSGKLDGAESYIEGSRKHYNRNDSFEVVLNDGKKLETRVYLAWEASIEKNLLPYKWYWALVMAGAIENKLPDDYVEKIRIAEKNLDPEDNRERKKEAEKILATTGYCYLLE